MRTTSSIDRSKSDCSVETFIELENPKKLRLPVVKAKAILMLLLS